MASNRTPPNALFVELVTFAANMMQVAKDQFNLRQPKFDPIGKNGQPLPPLDACRNYLRYLNEVIDEKKAVSWSKETKEAFKKMCGIVNDAKSSTPANADSIEFQFYRQAFTVLTQLAGMKNEKEIDKKLQYFDRVHEENRRTNDNNEAQALHQITKDMIKDEIFTISPVLRMKDAQSMASSAANVSAVESIPSQQAAGRRTVASTSASTSTAKAKQPQTNNPNDEYGFIPSVTPPAAVGTYKSTAKIENEYQRGDVPTQKSSPSEYGNLSLKKEEPPAYGELEVKPPNKTIYTAPTTPPPSPVLTSTTAKLMSSSLKQKPQNEYGELKLKKPEIYVGLTPEEKIVPATHPSKTSASSATNEKADNASTPKIK